MANKFITTESGTPISVSDDLDQQLDVLCEVAEILNIDDVSFARYVRSSYTQCVVLQ